MTDITISVLISAGTLVLSVLSSVFIAGTRWGQVRTEIAILKEAQTHAATKEELSYIRDSVAEIKGMFRLSIKEQ